MFVFVFVFTFFVLTVCLVFVGFYNCFYNCHSILMFALLVVSWPFCINKFELNRLVSVSSGVGRRDTATERVSEVTRRVRRA